MVLVALIYTYPFWKEPLKTGFSFTKDRLIEWVNSSETEIDTKTELSSPNLQTFSIANIEIGDSKATVEEVYGTEQASYQNEYQTVWYTYHQKYQDFFMVAYDQNQIVQALYTNQKLLSSTNKITFETTKETLRSVLGEPEAAIRKGLVNYLIDSQGEYDVYHLDDCYITFFYDLHENEKITAVQVIKDELELNKDYLYATSSNTLAEDFARLLFDLTNATRAKRDLSILEWSNQASQTAQKHSQDMAINDFFDHTNLDGESPFDRMTADGIVYLLAGENLAYGQTSSIFAHQGLLNSAGHRKNILNEEFQNLGIGVRFNDEDEPYFTELFFQ